MNEGIQHVLGQVVVLPHPWLKDTAFISSNSIEEIIGKIGIWAGVNHQCRQILQLLSNDIQRVWYKPWCEYIDDRSKHHITDYSKGDTQCGRKQNEKKTKQNE